MFQLYHRQAQLFQELLLDNARRAEWSHPFQSAGRNRPRLGSHVQRAQGLMNRSARAFQFPLQPRLTVVFTSS